MNYIKHLIECRCFKTVFQKENNIVFYKLKVFSLLDDNENIISKLIKCDNCGLIHKIYDIGKSEIIQIQEDTKSIATIDDIKMTIPNNIVNILESYNADQTIWEEVQFTIENNLWGKKIILTTDETDKTQEGKFLILKNPISVKIENFSENVYITEK